MKNFREGLQKANQVVKDIDIYGRSITLFHEGNASFNTSLGGYCTLVTGALIIIYIVTQIYTVFTGDFNVHTELKTLNAENDLTKYLVRGNDFQVAFNFTLSVKNDALQHKVHQNLEQYFEIQLLKIDSKTEETVNLGYEACDRQRVGRKNEFMKDLLSDQSYYKCLSFDSLELQGSYASNESVYYELQVNPCLPQYARKSSNCAKEEEVQTVITNSIMQTVVFSQFFNDTGHGLDSIQIVPHIYYFNYHSDQSFAQELLIKKNNLTLKDSWIYGGIKKINSEFFSSTLGKVSVGSIVPEYFPMLKLEIKRSFEEFYIVRDRQNLVDSLSDIGGFISLLQYGVKFGIYFYIEDKYKNSILRVFFKTQKNLIHKKNKKVRRIQKPDNELKGDERGLFETLISSIQQRMPLTVNPWRKYIYYLCFCRKRDLQTMQVEQSADDQLYKQLSIDTIINMCRHTQLFTILHFNRMQRMLIPYTYENLIMTKPRWPDSERDCLSNNSNDMMQNSKSIMKVMEQKFKEKYDEVLKKKKGLESVDDIAAALEYCISRQDQKINRKLIKQLINFEERDFSEQMILLRSVQGQDYDEWTKRVMKTLRNVNQPKQAKQPIQNNQDKVVELKIDSKSLNQDSLELEDEKGPQVEVRRLTNVMAGGNFWNQINVTSERNLMTSSFESARLSDLASDGTFHS